MKTNKIRTYKWKMGTEQPSGQHSVIALTYENGELIQSAHAPTLSRNYNHAVRRVNANNNLLAKNNDLQEEA